MSAIIGGWVVCPRGRLATEIDSTQTYTWPEIFDFWRETKMPAGRRRPGGDRYHRPWHMAAMAVAGP